MDGGDQLVSRKRHSGPDFISGLPLDIIHRILELVPIREAIRTCILSRRWRYIWATLPRLVFQDLDFMEWNRLKNLITNVLLLHKGPIHKFQLLYPLALENGPIHRWLLCLSRNEIRDLFLGIRYSKLPYGPFRVHSSLYSCLKLTHLQLGNCILPPPPPTFNGFSYLTSLILQYVKVPCRTLESLVVNAPLLENFSMITKIHLDSLELKFCAPNLKCFYISGYFTEIRLYAPLVAQVSVSLNRYGLFSMAENGSPACNYTKFLAGFPNLESLSGSNYFTKYLSIGIKSYDHSLVFHHLKSIHLYYMEDEDQLAVVGHLIMGAPNLQTLSIFAKTSTAYVSATPSTSYSDFGCGPNFTFNKLRLIRMEGLCGLPRRWKPSNTCLKDHRFLRQCPFFLTEDPKPRRSRA